MTVKSFLNVALGDVTITTINPKNCDFPNKSFHVLYSAEFVGVNDYDVFADVSSPAFLPDWLLKQKIEYVSVNHTTNRLEIDCR